MWAWRSLRTLTRSSVTGRCWPTRRKRPGCRPSSPAAPAGRSGTWSGIRPTSTTGRPGTSASRSPELIDDGIDRAGILGRGPADAGLIAAYRDGHAALVAALRDADPDLECATFMPAPSPLAFWARRQAHETAIHRYDAQSAAAAARRARPPPSTRPSPPTASTS